MNIKYNDTRTQITTSVDEWDNSTDTEKMDFFKKAKEIGCTHYLGVRAHNVFYCVNDRGAEGMSANGFYPKIIQYNPKK